MYEATLVGAPFVALGGYALYSLAKLKGLGALLAVGTVTTLLSYASDAWAGQAVSPGPETGLTATAILFGSAILGGLAAKIRPIRVRIVDQATLDDYARTR